jgi:hypothetical protein
MIQTTTKNSIPLQIGKRIVFLQSNDLDVNKELTKGDVGVITDISPLPRGNRHMIGVDWDNGSSMALIEDKDTYEVLSD